MSETTETMSGIDIDAQYQAMQIAYNDLLEVHQQLLETRTALERKLDEVLNQYQILQSSFHADQERWQSTLVGIRSYVIDKAVEPGDICLDEANRFFNKFGMEEYSPTQNVTLTIRLTVRDVPDANSLDQTSGTVLIPYFNIEGSNQFEDCSIDVDSVSINYMRD